MSFKILLLISRTLFLFAAVGLLGWGAWRLFGRRLYYRLRYGRGAAELMFQQKKIDREEKKLKLEQEHLALETKGIALEHARQELDRQREGMQNAEFEELMQRLDTPVPERRLPKAEPQKGS